MKCYIVGPVASGKTTLAIRLGRITGSSVVHLDNVLHVPDSASPVGNRKRSEEELRPIFSEILSQDAFILEDVGRKKFAAGMEAADVIVLLCPKPIIRKKRIVTRWVRQRMGLEACGYLPNLTMLRMMFRWTEDFDSGRSGLEERLEQYSDKLVILKTHREVEAWIRKVEKEST